MTPPLVMVLVLALTNLYRKEIMEIIINKSNFGFLINHYNYIKFKRYFNFGTHLDKSCSFHFLRIGLFNVNFSISFHLLTWLNFMNLKWKIEV